MPATSGKSWIKRFSLDCQFVHMAYDIILPLLLPVTPTMALICSNDNLQFETVRYHTAKL